MIDQIQAPKGFRIETDPLGEVRVPEDAYYGAQTQRAVENFQISGQVFPREFVRALGIIKLAGARANMQLGLLDERRGKAIEKASQEVIDGLLDSHFPVDIYQTGSGTSTNMNANEVIANRAIEILGGKHGDKKLIHPNDHVNMGQSSNDVIPTAIHIAASESIEKKLIPALEILEASLKHKSFEFDDVIKAGRTHLQDAVPMTLGQEFSGYATMIKRGINRIQKVRNALTELALGGTVLGTGLNAHPRFAELAIEEINKITGLTFRRAENYFEALQNKDTVVETSGALKTIAVSLMKIANDLRLLYSGPRTGFGEIGLPAVQPGSSIMPGKVNPVIPEAINMVAARVIGNDMVITIAGQNGNLELNTMMPVAAHALLESIRILSNGCKVFAEKCVDGIIANRERMLKYAEDTVALITVIAPAIGYDAAARIAKKAVASGKSVRELIIKEGILPKEKVDEILDLKKIIKGGRMEGI